MSSDHGAAAKLARAALTTMRKRLPGAVELVYDNAYALLVGFSPDAMEHDSPIPTDYRLEAAIRYATSVWKAREHSIDPR
jgi:hypothetical protein